MLIGSLKQRRFKRAIFRLIKIVLTTMKTILSYMLEIKAFRKSHIWKAQKMKMVFLNLQFLILVAA